MNKNKLAHLIKSYSNIHSAGEKPDVFIFSTPRSGSTWLMELIATQPKFKYCNEPLNMRNYRIRETSKIKTWEELYGDGRREKLGPYFKNIHNGRVRFLNPSPMRRYYRPFTSRIVYKIINGAEVDINWMAATVSGRVIYMLRHPIPVILSRKVLPRLDVFLNSELSTRFTNEQLDYAQSIVEGTDYFQKGAVSWCMQNAAALAEEKSLWTIVTYEQLVVDPEPVILVLDKNLELAKPEQMLAHLGTPSKVTVQSDLETKQHFQIQNESNRQWLIEKWKKRVSYEQIQFVQEMLDLFKISVYRADTTFPVMHWHTILEN